MQHDPDESPTADDIHDPTLGETTGFIKRALSDFASARVELAAIEVKEAAQFGAKKAIFGVALAICAFFTWTLLLAAITGILAPHADSWLKDIAWLPGWAAVLLVLGILHGIAAAIFLAKLRKKPHAPFFELTKMELENDKQWLKKNK